MADWDAIKAEYIAGGISYRKLAEKHGVSPTTLTKKAIAGKWADKRQQVESKRTARTIEKVAAAGAKVDTTVQDIACLLLERMRESIGMMDVVDAQSLSSYSVSLERLQRIRGEKSLADMEEQAARIEKLRREAESKQDQTATITVKLEGEMDEFAG